MTRFWPARAAFQPTPRFVSEGNRALDPGDDCARFQPTPRFVSEGNRRPRPWAWAEVSTHPPLRQRGERRWRPAAGRRTAFQPTPRFVSEGNVPAGRLVLRALFQPTPRFVSEGNHVAAPAWTAQLFQPTPRFVSEGNRAGPIHGSTEATEVSTHPPLRQRGERLPSRSAEHALDDGFNPPPASSARGTPQPPPARR